MKIIIIILIIFLIVEIYFKPRLEFTKNNNILLFYGRSKRQYIILR